MTKTLNYSSVVALAAVLVFAAFSVYAGGPHNKATGTVTWAARGGDIPGIVSSFGVHDLGDGANDKGTYTTSRPAGGSFPGGSLTMDVKCVNVDGDDAWFAGEVTEADGGYSDTVGDVFLYWVHDGGTPGAVGDKIGGTGKYGTIGDACDKVYDDADPWTGSGIVTDGNLKTHYWE